VKYLILRYFLRAQYREGGSDDFDLLVIGGTYGRGTFHGHISSFLLGAAVPPDKIGKRSDS
jgi:ATP-dependent DNA ligase